MPSVSHSPPRGDEDSDRRKRVKVTEDDATVQGIKEEKIKKEDARTVDMNAIPFAGSSHDAPASGHGQGSHGVKREGPKAEEHDHVAMERAHIHVEGGTLDAPASQLNELNLMIALTLRDVVFLNKLLEEMTKIPGDLDQAFFAIVTDRVDHMFYMLESAGLRTAAEDFIQEQSLSGDTITTAEFEALRADNFAQIESGKGRLLWTLAERLLDQSRLGARLVFRASYLAEEQRQKPALEANDGALSFENNAPPIYAKRLQLMIIARLIAIIAFNALVVSQTAAGKRERERLLTMFPMKDEIYSLRPHLHHANEDIRAHASDIRALTKPFNYNDEDFDKAFRIYNKNNAVGTERRRKLLDSLLLAVFTVPEFNVKISKQEH